MVTEQRRDVITEQRRDVVTEQRRDAVTEQQGDVMTEQQGDVMTQQQGDVTAASASVHEPSRCLKQISEHKTIQNQTIPFCKMAV